MISTTIMEQARDLLLIMGGEDGGEAPSPETTTVDSLLDENAAAANYKSENASVEEQLVVDVLQVDLDHNGQDQEQEDDLEYPSSEEGIQKYEYPRHHVDHVIDVFCKGDYLSERWVNHRYGRGRSGFYEVPPDMREQAGISEAGLLYNPKYVNFWEINELLSKQRTTTEAEGPSRIVRRQLSHYCYHLNSYTGGGKRERVETLMLQLYLYKYKGPEKIVASKFDEDSISADRPESRWVDHISIPDKIGLLFAAAFLGDLFSRSARNELEASIDPECAQLWVSELWSDLLLLENQIPLFRLTYPHPSDLADLYKNMGSYFSVFLPLNKKQLHSTGSVFVSGHFLHVLHFVHKMLIPSIIRRDEAGLLCSPSNFFWPVKYFISRAFQKPSSSSRMEPIPTVTRLQLAGVKFVPVMEEGFVVEFKKGVLKLPHLHVSQSTKKVLLNLIAWEKRHSGSTEYFINYAIFMDHLINTAKDVEILIQSRVFEHSLATDDDVAAIFNGLAQGLVYTKPNKMDNRYDIFPTLTVDINKYYHSRPNMWLANLMQEYFKSPWTIISFVAALFLILLTMLQTFFSVFAYVRPPHQ